MNFNTYADLRREHPLNDVEHYIQLIKDNCEEWLTTDEVHGDVLVEELYKLNQYTKTNPELQDKRWEVAAQIYKIISETGQQLERRHWSFLSRADLKNKTVEVSSNDGVWGLVRFADSFHWFPTYKNTVSPYPFFSPKLSNRDWNLSSKFLHDGRVTFCASHQYNEEDYNYTWDMMKYHFSRVLGGLTRDDAFDNLRLANLKVKELNELPKDAKPIANNAIPFLLSRVFISTTEVVNWYYINDDFCVGEMTPSEVISFYYFGIYRKLFKFSSKYIAFEQIKDSWIYREENDIRTLIQKAFVQERADEWLKKIKW